MVSNQGNNSGFTFLKINYSLRAQLSTKISHMVYVLYTLGRHFIEVPISVWQFALIGFGSGLGCVLLIGHLVKQGYN